MLTSDELKEISNLIVAKSKYKDSLTVLTDSISLGHRCVCCIFEDCFIVHSYDDITFDNYSDPDVFTKIAHIIDKSIEELM